MNGFQSSPKESAGTFYQDQSRFYQQDDVHYETNYDSNMDLNNGKIIQGEANIEHMIEDPDASVDIYNGMGHELNGYEAISSQIHEQTGEISNFGYNNHFSDMSQADVYNDPSMNNSREDLNLMPRRIHVGTGINTNDNEFYQLQQEGNRDVDMSMLQQNDGKLHLNPTNAGMLPINSYKLQYDANPLVVKKRMNDKSLVYKQNITVRFLRPPRLPAPGPLIIREVRPPQPQPAPPLVIRQRPPRPATPPPLVLRERPPKPPKVPGPHIIKKQLPPLPPPPRQVIIERYPQLPPKPRDVVVERWMPYGPIAKRRVIYQRAAQKPLYKPSKNMIVYYDAPSPLIQRIVRKQGVIQMDPREYVSKYAHTLLDKHMLMEQAQRAGLMADLASSVVMGAPTQADQSDGGQSLQLQPYLDSNLQNLIPVDASFASESQRIDLQKVPFGMGDEHTYLTEQDVANMVDPSSNDNSTRYNELADLAYASDMVVGSGSSREHSASLVDGQNFDAFMFNGSYVDSLNDVSICQGRINGDSGRLVSGSLELDSNIYADKLKLIESDGNGSIDHYNIINGYQDMGN